MIRNNNRYWGPLILINHRHGGNRQSLNVSRLLLLDKTYYQGETAPQIMSVNRLTARIIDAKGR
jgi:hypothetical protein